ncbi:cyclin-like protein [Circinella umbellata]|nr:cyclin-like protein [Circinella umbellata]
MVNDQWYFSKDDLQYTPSVIDGMTVRDEQMDRTKGCLYIAAIGAKLNLPQLAVATACTFLHRFYMRHSMAKYHVYDIGATCLFVATKAEESTRRMKDFVLACAQKAQKNDKLQLTEDSKDFIKWKETLLYNEIVLLHALCFDIALEHPYACLLEMEKELELSQTCVKRAWFLLYQSLGATFCLYYKPRTIAAAAIVLSWQFSSELPPSGVKWWDTVGVDPEQTYELAAEMVDFYEDHYTRSSSKASTPRHHSSQQQLHYSQGSSSQQNRSPSSQHRHYSSQHQNHYQQQQHH